MTRPSRRVRLASRGSTLARWQTDHVRRRLLATDPDLVVEVVVLRTTGDRATGVPLEHIGGRGLFTREVDGAVLNGEADAAVHSLKDLPTVLDAGLALAAVLERDDPRDAFLPAPGRPARLSELPPAARVGTSSLRRRALLLRIRPDVGVEDLRGNLDTRLDRLREGRYDAIVVALAGLRRLGRDEAVGEILEPRAWLPAPGQGALAVTTRADDAASIRRFENLGHPPTHLATAAERALLRTVEGGCQVPVGALATVDGGRLRLRAFVGSLDGRDSVAGEGARPVADEVEARALGDDVAQGMLRAGAAAILEAIRSQPPGTIPPVHAP